MAASRTFRQAREASLRSDKLAREHLALGHQVFERKRDIVVTLPALLRQQRTAGLEVLERRRVRCGVLRTLARDQIEVRHLFAALDRRDEVRAPIQLIDDLEYRLLPFSRCSIRDQE